ncbi:MAG: hypothetical protein LBB59_04590 [Campylobacteraceae bacterium]|jgi:hypothetical protein|nr:hypothetical protein [Campylobacteraceae bacterium]
MKKLVLSALSVFVLAGCAQQFVINSSESIAGKSFRSTGNKLAENITFSPEALIRGKNVDFSFYVRIKGRCESAFNKIREADIIADSVVKTYKISLPAYICDYDGTSTEDGRISVSESDFAEIVNAKSIEVKIRGNNSNKEYKDIDADFLPNIRKFYDTVAKGQK